MSHPSMLPQSHFQQKLTILGGILSSLCAALGLIVLVGWYTHNQRLLHVCPTFVAMTYNTALGFLLCGLGVLSIALRRPRFALAGSLYGLLIGSLTLSEYLFGWNIGIDQLFMRAYTWSGIISPGRMSISTALCLLSTGMALAIWVAPASQRHRYSNLIVLLGASVFGLGLIALSGYFTGIVAGYLWGQLTRMAVHTAVGFLLLGTSLIACAWREDSAQWEAGPRWLPGLVVICVTAVSICLWQAQSVEESARIAILHRLAMMHTHLPLASLTHAQTILPKITLLGGFLLAILLGWVVQLAQSAGRLASERGQINQRMELEIAERTQAEQALRTVRDGLETRVEERTAALVQANQAVRDVLLAVTEGRFHLCAGSQDLPKPLSPVSSPLPLSRTEGMRGLRHQTRASAYDLHFSQERCQDLETAVGEAAMNAVVHGGGGQGWVCTNTDGTVQVWVTDNGTGITMEHLPRATLERGFTTAGTLGHGFWLILRMVDRLWLLTSPTGTTLVLEQDAVSAETLWPTTALSLSAAE